MEVGLIRRINIDSEMQTAYLSYAMSVIVARALPDARDGLKPVQRRILYAMHEMGLRPDSAYRKSARIVGEVLGKYHPHGDASVYEAMARMAQDFSMRYLLVDGQGNFGSVDGDAPAAMRYTEARLHRTAMELLADIEKNTVDFTPNFDDTLTEPSVLPAALPNLLVNGANGIAVGMATSIPPHNLGEVCDALIYMLERWQKLDDVGTPDLMRYIKGPDFPTGGLILDDGEGLRQAYSTGRGRITVQAKMHVEDMGRGRSRLIISELPFQTNKSALIERIADLVREGTIEGIADLRDESDRQGMRVVIELAKTAEPNAIIRELYKRTSLQGTFSIITLALVNGEPRTLTLKQALRVFLDHRLEVVKRRSEFDLARARERAHILEGLLIALKHLDEVIRIIRASRDTDEARAKLIKRFKLSELQANAILEMPLKRLARLEREKIEAEYKEKLALIKQLEKLLASPKLMRELIAEELRGVKQKFADPRRTRIVRRSDAAPDGEAAALTTADLMPDQQVWVTVLANGLISRTPDAKPPRTFDAPPLAVLAANTRDILYLITLKGRAASLPVFSIPERENPADGAPWSSVCALDANARVVAAVAVSADMVKLAEAGRGRNEGREENGGNGTGCYLMMASANGMVKKTSVADLPGVTAQVFNVMNVAEDDGLVGARLTNGSDEVLLVTSTGRSIRFREGEVRPMGLAAAGVMGIKPGGADDKVIGLEVVREKAEVFLLTNEGMGKRTELKEFPTQGRYGMGVTAADLAGKQRLIGLSVGTTEDRVIVVTNKDAAKVIKFDAAGRKKRPARGSGVVTLKPGETVTRLVPLLAPFRLPEPAEAPAAKPVRGPKAEKVKANGAASQPALLRKVRPGKPAQAAGKAKSKKK
ncbi:MAG: DNA gyrase subunit A [Anaerolineales bacterium]|nr:DNA gyrase subunit A [Anaerolineales bacterium]